MYYATNSKINAVFWDGTSPVTTLSVADAKLGYDKQLEKLIYQGSTFQLMSADRDGTNPTEIATGVVSDELSVDYMAGKVFYLENLFKRINSIETSTGTETANIVFLGPNVLSIDSDEDSQ